MAGCKCRLAWETVCRPTCFGGLGVLDLRFFGYALWLRWEWLRRAEPRRCWVTLSARLEKPVAAMAAVTMVVRLGDGEAGAFWYDSWLPVGPLCRHAPHLFRAISRTDRKRTIKDALMHNRWASDIRGGINNTSSLSILAGLGDVARDVSQPPTIGSFRMEMVR